MRRGRGVALVAAVATLLGLAGCTPAPEVGDGSLGITWAALPTPAVPMPKVGECSGAPGSMTTVSWDPQIFGDTRAPAVDCSAPHVSETFHVGTFAADASADATTRPKLGGPRFRTAYETCAQQATDFMGADFHGARVMVRPVMPTERQWTGNARWFRCEVIEVTNANGSIKARTGSLRDGLRGDRPLAITCGNESLSQDQKYVENVTYVDCATSHDIELTGVYLAPDEDYPGDERVQTAALDACYTIGASYLGLTRSGLDATGGVRWLFWGGSSDLWSVGDRSHRCYMGDYQRRKLTASIKGRKPGSFPH